MQPLPAALDEERRRRVRRSAILFGLVAVGFYVGFIVMMLVRATR
jgi:hypothetical protein